MTTLPADAAALLEFWFADALTSPAAARRRVGIWFGHHPEFDAELIARFGDWPARALRGDFAHWRETPRGALALLIALDQLPRNVHRGSALAYACDAAACALASDLVADDLPAGFAPIEVPFCYLPFEHAEELAIQHRCIAGYERELARATSDYAWLFQDCLREAHNHCELIARYGRFPHRNAILGRTSTSEELAYLADGGRHWNQQAPVMAIPVSCEARMPACGIDKEDSSSS